MPANGTTIKAFNGISGVVLSLVWLSSLLYIGTKLVIWKILVEILVPILVLTRLPYFKRELRAPIAVTWIVVVALGMRAKNAEFVAPALYDSGVLAAFLGSMLALRLVYQRSAEVEAARKRVAVAGSDKNISLALIASSLIGSILSYGAFQIIQPIFSDAECAAREKMAAAALCGVGLSIFWSPLSVGFIYSTQMVPNGSPLTAVAASFAVALIGLYIAAIIYGSRTANFFRQLSPLVPMLPGLLGVGVLTLAICLFANMPVSAAALIAAPVIALCYLPKSGDNPVIILKEVGQKLGSSSNDLILYVSGFFVSGALRMTPLPGLEGAASMTWSTNGAFALLVLGSLVLAISGLYAPLCISIIAAFGNLMAVNKFPTPFLMLLMFSWAAASTLSYTGVTVSVAQQSFLVPTRCLIFSRNIAVMFMVALVLYAVFVVSIIK